MYYELGTMVAIRNNATPFANHEKGISIPSIDVVGEIISIHPTTLSYTVRLSKKFALTFSEDDIYGLPGWMSGRRDMFHKMLSSIGADVHHPFYYVKEFESYITSENRLSDRLIDNAIEKYCKYDSSITYKLFKNRCPEYFPGYSFTPARRPLKALEELNRREAERIAAEPIRIEIDDMIKANYSKEEIKKMINKEFGTPVATLPFTYKKIIFNGPCTIILWKDGTKTIARASDEEDTFDPEKGVAICFMKKIFGHTETNKILRKASKQYEDYIEENRPNVSFDEFIDFCKDYFKSDTKPIDHIDQSTIDEVKKVEEDQQDE